MSLKVTEQMTRDQIALTNRSLVYEAFGEGEKLTIAEVSEKVNATLRAQKQKPLSERTVRRSIETLVTKGFIKTFGKHNNAGVYGKLDASFASAQEKEEIIPLGGNLVTVEDFLRLLAAPESHPFQKGKLNIWSDEIENTVRRRMLHAVLTSGDAGMDDALKGSHKGLLSVVNELEYAAALLKAFVDSPIWYQQYRDRIAYEIRKVQEKDPELFQLGVDYVRGG